MHATEKRAAGVTTHAEADIKGKIVEFLWYLKRQGYSHHTVKKRVWYIKRLVKLGADIFDEESVKDAIAKQESWCDGTKLQATQAYASFAIMAGLAFHPPRYKQAEKLPFIPTEEEIDQLIAGCGKKMATFLHLLKETGMRRGEAWRLEWTDIDAKHRTVRIEPEKGSNPRILPISATLIGMLDYLPKDGSRIWTTADPDHMGTGLCAQRKRIAKKLQNPRIGKISFHTLRHWKATEEYHRTKDILHVMKMLGHKNIECTLLYIDLEKALYRQPSNEAFTARVAETVDDACKLIEAGFEYVTDIADKKLFRKRK